MKDLTFTFSDTIGGYVTDFDWSSDAFGVRTPDGRDFRVTLTDTTGAELVRNLGEPYVDVTQVMKDMLVPGGWVLAYGIFYPQGDGYRFDAKHLIFTGRHEDEFVFERPDWWITQITQFADFYLSAEFGGGPVDFRAYRTTLSTTGTKPRSDRQETDTISRLVYGFATGYLMTGDDRYLEAAEKGTGYLRDHARFVDESEDIVYWYHAIDIEDDEDRKVFASEFGDDFDALPAYEQIYAIAGPTQTYRITGDPLIKQDIDRTVRLFENHYKDPELEGYWSHIDPITLDGRAESLAHNRARKNWNSVGDHIPAYLINVWLATGDPKYRDMLLYCADLIVEHMQDYERSPFVNEKFHADWSHDHTWGWQQNRAVVGHNLKIAWNLMRLWGTQPKESYEAMARKIAEVMPTAGMDRQRGGWYDVVEREKRPGEDYHRYVWHDRKAWWQQEQAILAYLILSGTLHEPAYLKLARESSAFHNAMFLDHDEGGVYFNVLANGIPYLMGTERLKGSHSMGGYHSTELCYLAAVYTNLLITKEPLDLYFKPKPGGFPDGVLRPAPDILPPGSIRIGKVWVDDAEYTDFDAEGLTVNLPQTDADVRVKVRIVPSGDPFDVSSEISGAVGTLTMSGTLDVVAIPPFERELQKIIDARPTTLVLRVGDLTKIAPAGIRGLALARSKLGMNLRIVVVGADEQVREAFVASEMGEEAEMVDSFDPSAPA